MKRILTIDLDNIPQAEHKRGEHEDFVRFHCLDNIINELIFLSKCQLKEDCFNVIGIALDTIAWLRNTNMSDSRRRELLLLYILKDIKRNVEKQSDTEFKGL